MPATASTLLAAVALWLLAACAVPQTPPPDYYLNHPEPASGVVYGVGRGTSFLEAKLKALDDIATQLNSRVASITTVHKQGSAASEVTRNITVLTRKDIGNYDVVDQQRRDDDTVYLLLRHRIESKPK